MLIKTRTKPKIEIKANTRVILNIQLKNDIDGMENMLSLSSVIEDILDDGSLLIHMPIYQSYHYPLPHDSTFSMLFVVDSEMYALPVQFQERVERGSFILAKISRTGKIRPHQRRDCYRLPCSLPITVERLWLNERELCPDCQPTEGQMINFSDGGMLFATNEHIDKDEKVTITFTFDMGVPETIEGMALRLERIENGKYLFRVAVRFRNKDKAQKRRFYKYIVEMQLQERRRWTQDMQPSNALKQDNEDSEQP